MELGTLVTLVSFYLSKQADLNPDLVERMQLLSIIIHSSFSLDNNCAIEC